jgi:catechol 2,3-dioxygenase-like lactoylglutathione lyase family enzyme
MKNIEIIMIPSKDRQAAKEFYKKLGFSVIADTSDAHGDAWIQVGFPGQDTTLSLAGFHAVICETENIGKEISELRERGVQFGKIDDTPWGRFSWTKDPDGNGICLHEKLKG